MRKESIFLIALGIISALVLALPTLAVPAPKVFVCKYVGTPGVDERLQTGQNPISVSSNSIKDYQGVGSFFNDAHGRSFVLEIDTGQDEPDVSRCPKPEEPETPEEPEEPTIEEDEPVIVPEFTDEQGEK